MKTFQALRQEVNAPLTGEYAPYYFRFLGYKGNLGLPTPLLRARGIEALFTLPTPYIFKNDLIVGNVRCYAVSVDKEELEYAARVVNDFGLRGFGTNADHFAPDYKTALFEGIPGTISRINSALKTYEKDEKKTLTLTSMKIAMEAFYTRTKNYRDAALKLKGAEGYDNEKLKFIANNLSALLLGAPQTFAQALQLVWLIHTAFYSEGRAAMALARMDQYLYPYYKKDVGSGILTDEYAVELLQNVFTKIPTNDVVNIVIGGKGLDEKSQVNELSYLIVEAVKTCNAPGPNLSARITPDAPDEFLIACLKSIGTGLGYPALMNDEVNIPALLSYGYKKEDVYDYCMVGCIENFITGKQPPWSDGRFDSPRFFDYIFFNGVSKFNRSVGPVTGNIEQMETMQDFTDAMEKQMRLGVAEYYAYFMAHNNRINQEYFAEPFLSCFCQDCIGRGLDINNGGSVYPSVHGAGLMGVGTFADSMAAIEHTVFVEKTLTLPQIRNALAEDFVGYEDVREKLLAAPKYGNNDDFVDKYAVWYLDVLADEFKKYKTRDGGGVYVAMAANIHNVLLGREINATPDGRKAGTPLSDAASPTYGKDVKGPTSTLNSVSKPHYEKAACGTVINQKFFPSAFSDDHILKLLALVRAYFKKGGQEIQINATSREVLLDALAHPENYQNLVVRVSGFSDYFIRLDKDVQLDILNRTQQGE